MNAIVRALFAPKYVFGRELTTNPLMLRLKLLRTPWGNLDIHVFFRSDEGRDLHDHPWSYVSLILAGGYWEHLPVDADGELAIWRKPGSLLVRPATWTHRVELDCDPRYRRSDAPLKRAVTLIWTSKKSRTWGFRTKNGWVDWRAYHGIDA